MKKVILVFGTRPEAIKMAPLVKEFQKYSEIFETSVCVTGQHREMLDQVLRIFDITPDNDLNIMKQGQDLYDVTSRVLLGMRDVLREARPDVVLVHGDTTTSMAAALAAFYQQIPVGHVEAGLRTHNIYSPWPEEMNRQITGRIATYHFAPTELSRRNLLSEGIEEKNITVTGNTVIDALYMVVEKMRRDTSLDEELRTELKDAGYDLKEIAAKLAENYIKQIVDDGFFHADPHPGNLRIRDGKIVWIDFGMMGILNRCDKDLLKDAVLAIGQNDTQKLVDVILTLGQHDNRIDYALFYDNIETFMKHYVTMDLTDINLGDVVQEIFMIAHKHRISMPKGVSMLARGLVTIESTVMLVDPHISIIEIAANHVASHMSKEFDAKKELTNSAKKVYDASQNILNLPVQLSEVIRMIMKGRLKVNLDIMESSVPMKAINHMVNKLIVGIISAGLLMASSLLCTTQMTPKVFGIPALGFIGFMTAVGLGIWLLFTVLKERRKNK